MRSAASGRRTRFTLRPQLELRLVVRSLSIDLKERMEPVNLNLEPTLLGAAWRYKWLVLATTQWSLRLSPGGTADSNETWTATAPLRFRTRGHRSSSMSNSQLSPERYVADQIQIAQVPDRRRSSRSSNWPTYDPPIVIDGERCSATSRRRRERNRPADHLIFRSGSGHGGHRRQ